MKQLSETTEYLSGKKIINPEIGINLNYKKADVVLLDDHINLQSGNPLTGKYFDELGGRFPDMSLP